MASYNKIECEYDPINKTLIVHKPITNYLPNYVYQMCVKAERREKDENEKLITEEEISEEEKLELKNEEEIKV